MGKRWIDPPHENQNGSFTAILDHFVTSDPALYEQHRILGVSATDHLPIFASRKKIKEIQLKEKIFGRAHSKLKNDENGIPIHFLKMTKQISSNALCHIINRSILTNVEPLKRTHAIISSLFKDGDRNLAINDIST